MKIRTSVKFSTLLSIMVLLAACVIKPPAGHNVGDEIDSALQEGIRSNQALEKNAHEPLPPAVSAALLPNMSIKLPGAGEVQEKRFDVSVKDVPAPLFFEGLMKGTTLSIIVGPNVGGTITLDLKNVTIQQVMDAVRDVYGYEYRRTPYGYQVLQRQLQSRIFSINYLDITRTGESQTIVSTGQITRQVASTASTEEETGSTTGGQETSPPSSSINTSSTSDFWTNLHDSLDAIVGTEGGRSVVVNPESGIVVVRAYPNELREVADYLDSTQAIVKRQVVLEAKILEVELSANFQTGIDWTLLRFTQTGNKNLGDNLDTFANIFTMTGSGKNNFTFAMKALQTQGRVYVLSSPRIATLNNQKAAIKVGKDRFFVTNVSNTTSLGGGTTTAATQDVTLTPFFSGVALDVIPQISADGKVTLHIHPMVSTVVDETRTFTVSGQSQILPMAKSTIRESDSVVEADSGQVIAIGGLMENRSDEYKGSTPVVDDIPGLSPLLSNRHNTASKFELVILLRPMVVGAGTWNQTLQGNQEEVENTQGDFGYKAKFKKPPLPRAN